MYRKQSALSTKEDFENDVRACFPSLKIENLSLSAREKSSLTFLLHSIE